MSEKERVVGIIHRPMNKQSKEKKKENTEKDAEKKEGWVRERKGALTFQGRTILAPLSRLTATTCWASKSLGPHSRRKGTPFISQLLNFQPGL